MINSKIHKKKQRNPPKQENKWIINANRSKTVKIEIRVLSTTYQVSEHSLPEAKSGFFAIEEGRKREAYLILASHK